MATNKSANPKSDQPEPIAIQAEPVVILPEPTEMVEKAHLESDQRVPVVGIGASAGGLDAFEQFFTGMPADKDPEMAFVLVQHLAPDHKSFLADIIKRYTRMEVFEVADGMVVRPNCTYIIPPNRDMALLNGTLRLYERPALRGNIMPIDIFFRSLSEDQHDRGMCIILSGTGSDGTLGLRAIKGEGGMVMVQNPDTTDYNGMPLSAIATGLADFVLHPAEMAAQLISYVSHSNQRAKQMDPQGAPREESSLKNVRSVFMPQPLICHDFVI